MENYYRQPKNICHFEGLLFGYSVSVVGDGHPLGKGELRLKEPGGDLYQSIPVVAWYDIAERLCEVPDGSWVKILCSYSENVYAGRTYPQFTVSYFSVV